MDEKRITELAKALSDPKRLEIFRKLQFDLCVSALASEVDISESAVSQHLKQLRKASLVQGFKRSYWTHYRADIEALWEFSEMLAQLAEEMANPEPECINGGKCTCQGEEGCPAKKKE